MGLTAAARHLDLYRRLIGAYVRSEMQYRVSFGLRVVGSFLVTITDFAGIAVVLSRVPHLAGWTLPEVALLYGLTAVSFSLAEMLGGALDFFDEFIRAGTFDRLLIRPLGLLYQTATEGFSLRRLGRAGQGAVVCAFALSALELRWSPDKVLVLALTFLGGIGIYFSIFVLSASFCFWIVQGKEATHVFTYGGDFLSSYPLDVYRGWLRRFVTFVIPLAFVNYYPALYLLDRADPLGLPPWARLLSPVVAAAMGLLAWRVWSIGVRRYQSTGT
jgi:ABC-2 type transport system permease protein